MHVARIGEREGA